MNTNDIVAGGGWIQHQSVGRPRTRLFFLLSLIWLGVALVGSVPFWQNAWPPSFSGAEWGGLALMLPEPVFIVLAIKFALTEPQQTTVARRPNPAYDPRKLY